MRLGAPFLSGHCQELDRYRLAQRHVPGGNDDAHAADTDDALDAVLSRDDRSDARHDVVAHGTGRSGHGHRE